MSTPATTSRPSTRPTDAPEHLLGRTLEGRFQLNEVLSEGGMGIVYRATQLSVNRPVAVKVIRPTLARDPDLMQRFLHETQVVAKLQHPNIVNLIESGRDMNGLVYIAMEFVEGKTFREALEELKLSLLEILHVFVQVCDALIEAHYHGIIHRDLKFENVLICQHRDGRVLVKVVDFGVAKQLTHDGGVTRAGEVPGTPGVIAPELVTLGAPSAQSDLYSLGVMLFTALTGRPPFDGQNDFEVMQAHLLEDLPNLYTLVGDRVPEVVIELAAELMEKEPDMRPPDAKTVRDRLELIIRRLERQMMDHPRYIPPPQEGLRPLHPPIENAAARSGEFLGRTEENQGPVAPAVAPLSVVGVLLAVVIVLSLAVIYLLFRQHTG